MSRCSSRFTDSGIATLSGMGSTARALPRNLLAADHFRVAPQHAHWPLVFMLVLTQLSVGAFVVAQVLGRLADTRVVAALRPFHTYGVRDSHRHPPSVSHKALHHASAGKPESTLRNRYVPCAPNSSTAFAIRRCRVASAFAPSTDSTCLRRFE
jgi:hypothetical protein